MYYVNHNSSLLQQSGIAKKAIERIQLSIGEAIWQGTLRENVCKRNVIHHMLKHATLISSFTRSFRRSAWVA